MRHVAHHDGVFRLVAARQMCLSTALDKAFENIDCISATLRCQAKNRFYESIKRLIELASSTMVSAPRKPDDQGYRCGSLGYVSGLERRATDASLKHAAKRPLSMLQNVP